MTDSEPRQEKFLLALGATVHGLRVERGLSQQELGEMAGLHRTYISDIERAARNLRVTTINRVAEALGISASKLFTLVDDRLNHLT